MAKRGKLPKPKDPASALEQMERPTIKWRTLAIIAVAFVVLWVTAFMVLSFDEDGVVGWISVSVVGALTLAAIGFGIYVWRLTRKSRGIVDILAQATDEEGRKRALEQLQEGDAADALNALARSQLMAREDPKQAMEILEGIDLDKAPAVVQDDVRANLGFLYLMNGRAKAARELADDLRLDRQPNAKAKGMYAAVMAESFARTGKADEAKKLVETYDAEDPEYGDVAAMLYRAQVYTFFALKKKGRAAKAMNALARTDPNMVAPFLQGKVRPQLKKMAMDALRSMGMAPRPQMQVQRK